MSISFSVVVSTKGRDSVYNTIESLKQQTHPIEIVLINDGSEKPIQLCNTDVLYLKNSKPRGLSICRNMGIKQSSGEVIAFIDDDAFADPNWIKEIKKCFKKGADIAGGLIKPVWKAKRPWWLKEWMYHLLGVNTPSHMIFGCNFAIRKNLLKEMNYWFEEKLGRKEGNMIAGDETTLFLKARKQNYKILFNEKAIVYHVISKERLSLKYFIPRFFWEGRTEARRGTTREPFIGRLSNLLFYPYRIIKSKFKVSLIEDFLLYIFFSIPYLYGMLHELIFGATDYKEP